MYDYLEIRSDSSYSRNILVSVFNRKIIAALDLQKIGNVSFVAMVGKYSIPIMGVLADSKGNYSFGSDDEFEEINLVEINIPQEATDLCDEELMKIARTIARLFNWEIWDHDTEMVVFTS